MKANRYPGHCHECGELVPAGAGLLRRGEDRWLVLHETCPAGSAPATATTTPTGFEPTAEQVACLELFQTGESLVIEAGAGTGKTSTLRLLANATDRRGRYLAFNKAIVEDVRGSLPRNVVATTAHSLAHTAIVKGTGFAARLAAAERVKSAEVARYLELEPFAVLDDTGDLVKFISPDRLAGITLRSLTAFCQTADPTPTRRHVVYVDGIDDPGPQGARTYRNNRRLAETLEPAVQKAWTDVSRPTGGRLLFKHDYYLKLWQLSNPHIDCDFILFDEAQDANPVMLAVVEAQTHAQRVLVGDANQAIYEFTGAVNAIERAKALGWPVRQLTRSFRFGPTIAAVANDLLGQLEADLRLVGHDVEDQVGPTTAPDAILTRTNAVAVECVLTARRRGARVHLVGGGTEILRFARAAHELKVRGTTQHPDLACFSSWDEVQRYVKEDEQGSELKLQVDLLEGFGIETIIEALGDAVRETDADLIVSTAHKAKGREWDTVQLGQDFVRKPGGERQPPAPAELRLQYVATTRARRHLDNEALTGGPR